MIITDLSILRAPNAEVKPEEIAELVEKLERELSMSRIQGVGLAAPQIGINKRIAIIRINEYENLNLVNPVIVERKGMIINKEEGCLSFPNIVVNTYRYREIVVKDDFHPAGFVATHLSAIVVLHEVEHLSGILMIDREIKTDKIGRNDPCPCGSSRKFKNCCMVY